MIVVATTTVRECSACEEIPFEALIAEQGEAPMRDGVLARRLEGVAEASCGEPSKTGVQSAQMNSAARVSVRADMLFVLLKERMAAADPNPSQPGKIIVRPHEAFPCLRLFGELGAQHGGDER